MVYYEYVPYTPSLYEIAVVIGVAALGIILFAVAVRVLKL